ncbi:hypothetical protein AB837_00081 [bacterium AB1]|nr:hypothetical protein AB837_00081 [bacterium AB1]
MKTMIIPDSEGVYNQTTIIPDSKDVYNKLDEFFDKIQKYLKDLSREERNDFQNYVFDFRCLVSSACGRVHALSEIYQNLADMAGPLCVQLEDSTLQSLSKSNLEDQQSIDRNDDDKNITANENKNIEKKSNLGWGMVSMIVLLFIGGNLLLYKINAEIARYLDRNDYKKHTKLREIK